MITMFVRVDGQLLRYNTNVSNEEAIIHHDTLREMVADDINPGTKTVGPILMLIDNVD